MKIKYKQMRLLGVSLLFLMNTIFISENHYVFAKAEEPFEILEPTEIPTSYSILDAKKQWYVCTESTIEKQYCVYGRVNEIEGFYVANADGEVVLPYQQLSISQTKTSFVTTQPGSVPAYYIVLGTLYQYKKNDGVLYYRVHGIVQDQEGFYASDSQGNIKEPMELLDPIEEANFALHTGIKEEIVDTLDENYANQAAIDKWEVTKIVDGIPTWDTDDVPGNDSGPENHRVRSFDKVLYNICYSTKLQNQETPTYFRNGEIYVQFELPCSLSEARFVIEEMNWLMGAKQEEVNGKVVVTGTRELRAGEQPTVIPSPDANLTVVVEVLGMKNEEKIQPTFTGYVLGNPKSQYQKVQPREVVVSAAPAYNVYLDNNTSVQWKDTFDFTTGLPNASNHDKGNVVGRLYGYGVVIELRNKDINKKLKGIELPNGKIHFDLELTVKKSRKDITGEDNDRIMPLLWDYKGNSVEKIGNLGRNMYVGDSEFAVHGYKIAPFNQYTEDAIFSSVVDGGNWKASQNGNIIEVEIDAYQFLMKENGYHFPMYGSGVSENDNHHIYGIDKGRGVFSAGYFQILFPFMEEIEAAAIYELVVEDTNFSATSIQGAELSNTQQVCSDDDRSTVRVHINVTGKYAKQNAFTLEDQTSDPWATNVLSPINQGYGADGWTTPGSIVQLWSGVTTDTSNDLEDHVYAYNTLQKFDDEAMQALLETTGTPTTIRGQGSMKIQLLYATKPGGLGWQSDEEMNACKEEELEYFATMEDVKKKYPTGVCVAILIGGREGKLPVDRVEVGLKMQVSKDAEIGKVYQTTNDVKIWIKQLGEQMTLLDTTLSQDKKIQEKLKKPDIFLDGNGEIYGPYIKTQYDENREIRSISHTPRSYMSGASLLMVGLEVSITKTVSQYKGTEKQSVYDMTAGQRRVDYELHPVVKLVGNKDTINIPRTTVTITDILPKGITVTPTTKYYYGGIYEIDTNNVNGGQLVGGTEIFLEEGYPQQNSDGSLTLKWVLEDIVPGEDMESIYFSAMIGTPGNDTTDVKNLEQLSGQAMIQAEGDG